MRVDFILRKNENSYKKENIMNKMREEISNRGFEISNFTEKSNNRKW